MEHTSVFKYIKLKQSQQGESGEEEEGNILHVVRIRCQILYTYLSHLNLTIMGTLTHLTDEGTDVKLLANNQSSHD